MLFNTMQYIIFLAINVLIYYCLPGKVRYIWLLASSYYFYMQWNPWYATLLLFCTLLTYLGGRMIEKCKGQTAKICLVICIIINAGILWLFKYFMFGIQMLNRLMSCFHLHEIRWEHDILLPVGISFFTFQALGYLIDVYRGDICAEKNFLRYALFVSFFPQLVAGPIERSGNLLVQLRTSHSFQYENLRRGLLLILYGLFLKMVIADRAAVIVDTVYGNTTAYQGYYVVVATLLFAIQIYCDFYGYSVIARGSAQLLGIQLTNNFDAPYYAKSVTEFWRRWHISLSGWFRDYLYIPLGGSRKGKWRKRCNILIVFAVSGLWHGASLRFIVWGLLNGAYQVLEDTAGKFRMRMAVTFPLVTFSWIFFRAGGIKNAFEIIKSMISVNNWRIFFNGELYLMGVAPNYMKVLLGAIFVLFAVDYHKYQGKDVADLFLKQNWCFRVTGIMLLIFGILLYGCYGKMYDVQQFIYFQF